jgi:hypothetical protein
MFVIISLGYSNITKRKILQSLKGKLSPPSGHVINPRHAIKANKSRYMKEHDSDVYNSLPGISRDGSHAVSKTKSRSELSKMQKLVTKHFGSNKDLNINNKSDDVSSYGKSTRNAYNNQGLNSRQILQRLQKKKRTMDD